MSEDKKVTSELYRLIYRAAKRIPPGRVATYGQVAALAGIPRGARIVGYAMRVCPEDVPWQRVVGRRSKRMGKISIRNALGGAMQRKLLEQEGVELTEAGSIRLDEFGWLEE